MQIFLANEWVLSSLMVNQMSKMTNVQQNIDRLSTAALIISNKKKNDTMKIVKSLEKSGLLIKQ